MGTCSPSRAAPYLDPPPHLDPVPPPPNLVPVFRLWSQPLTSGHLSVSSSCREAGRALGSPWAFYLSGQRQIQMLSLS